MPREDVGLIDGTPTKKDWHPLLYILHAEGAAAMITTFMNIQLLMS